MRLFIRGALLGLALVAITLTALVSRKPAATSRRALFLGARIDDPTLHLFQRSCQNCHSENTRWPWYSRVPPAAWLIAKDVNDARRHVNFSQWDSYPAGEQENLLARIGSVVRAGQMPLPRYVFLHRDAALTAPERQHIYEWTKAERKRLRAAEAKTSTPSVSLLFAIKPELPKELGEVTHDKE